MVFLEDWDWGLINEHRLSGSFWGNEDDMKLRKMKVAGSEYRQGLARLKYAPTAASSGSNHRLSPKINRTYYY